MTDETIEEVRQSLQWVRHEFQDLAVGGLRTIGPERLPALQNLAKSFQEIGAGHLASRLRDVVRCIEDDNRSAGEALMKAQSSFRSFERLLTLEIAEAQLGALLEGEDNEEDHEEDQ